MFKNPEKYLFSRCLRDLTFIAQNRKTYSIITITTGELYLHLGDYVRSVSANIQRTLDKIETLGCQAQDIYQEIERMSLYGGTQTKRKELQKRNEGITEDIKSMRYKIISLNSLKECFSIS